MPHRKDPEATPMKVITINIPWIHVEFFNKVVKYGYFPSRSEALRQCINMAMPKIEEQINYIEKFVKKGDIPNVKEFLEKLGYEVRKNRQIGARKTRKVNPLGNIYWEDIQLKNGDLVRVPKENNGGFINE